jgi:hypothetical protein
MGPAALLDEGAHPGAAADHLEQCAKAAADWKMDAFAVTG